MFSRCSSRPDRQRAERVPSPLGDKKGGQALVEYLLMLSISIALVLVLQSGFRQSVGRLWAYYAQNIAAGCPGQCQPTSSLAW